eukprot:950091-Pyramimonas_sp.AAC.1
MLPEEAAIYGLCTLGHASAAEFVGSPPSFSFLSSSASSSPFPLPVPSLLSLPPACPARAPVPRWHAQLCEVFAMAPVQSGRAPGLQRGRLCASS